MCFEPISATIAVVTAIAAGVGKAIEIRQQNNAMVQQYKQEQKQQQLINQQAIEQFQSTQSRLKVEQQRDAQSAFTKAQQSILENQRRQATAQASSATAGITGTPLDMLFNDYQVSIGNVASNLQTTYGQLNENLFFNLDDARRQAQSRVNAAVPVRPNLISPLGPSLMAGGGKLLGGLAGSFTGFGGGGGGTSGTMTQSTMNAGDRSALWDASSSLA